MSTSNNVSGRALALENLSGRATEKNSVGLFTWTFNYIWKVAGIEPWRLALGGHDTWHRAHMALYERHRADIVFYEGAGSGDADPRLDGEDHDRWYMTDMTSGVEYVMTKKSLTLYQKESHKKSCDSVGKIESRQDADRLCTPFTGYGDSYLKGLKRLIDELGDRALVMPHYSPSYICACYDFGFESAMMTMMDDPDLFEYVMAIHTQNEDLRMKELKSAGAEAVFFADGWSSYDIISPALFEKFCFPSQRSILEAAESAGLRSILWDEGDIKAQLPRLAEQPFSAFASEQSRKGAYVSVADMRKAFGPDRCLFGNLDSEEMLIRGDEAEIRGEVRRQIAEAEGGPFVVMTGSPLPDDVSPEAVDIMIDEARNGGQH